VSRVVALVAARDEADRVGATVEALASIGSVDAVIVVDDGSRDATSDRARAAGATVLRRGRPAGKGRALERALSGLPAADVWLLADADLGATAGGLSSLVDAVTGGRADVAIATFPPGEGGGFGLVQRFARSAIRRLGGIEVLEPLSGQRALSTSALVSVRPLAPGFGIETAMTIDAGRAGLRIVEIPVALSHRATYRDLRGFAHRGRQGLDIARAVVRRALPRR
jgi:glycosyltransferase involved in cell wall biosynthesis